jgi:chromosome partitioning protein
MIITTGGIKGGSGKTTIATNLTIMLANKGFDVLLVDADDQETATDFTAWREESTGGNIGYTAVKITGDAVRTQVLKLTSKYDHIIIDTGGRDTSSQRAALSVSDVYLVPFTPRSFDIWTLRKVEILVSEIMIVSPKLKAYIFLNRADSRGADNDDAAEHLKQSEYLSYLDSPIGNRKVFSNAAASGLGVTEVKPTDEKANNELISLFEKITNF